MSANNMTSPDANNTQTATPVNLLQAGGQPITFTGAGGQQYTVIPASSLNLGQTVRHGANIIQVPNIASLSNIQGLPVQNIPGIGNVQVIPASALQQSQLALSPLQNQQTPTTPTPAQQPAVQTLQTIPAGAQIIGQHIQQDPNDPSKWQVVQSINAASTPQPPPLQPANIVVNTTSTPGPATTPDPLQTDPIKVKVRRVACTCPNCSEGER